MEIHYTITEEDYVNFNIDHHNSSKIMKSYRLFFRYFPIILFAAIGSSFRSLVMYLISTAVFAVIWIVISPKIFEASIKWSAIANIKNGKGNDFIGNQTLKLTDDYIQEKNSHMASNIKYSSVERIIIGHGLIYLYIGAIKALIIPLSAFTDNEHKNAFLLFIVQKSGLDISDIVKCSE